MQAGSVLDGLARGDHQAHEAQVKQLLDTAREERERLLAVGEERDKQAGLERERTQRQTVSLMQAQMLHSHQLAMALVVSSSNQSTAFVPAGPATLPLPAPATETAPTPAAAPTNPDKLVVWLSEKEIAFDAEVIAKLKTEGCVAGDDILWLSEDDWAKVGFKPVPRKKLAAALAASPDL